MTLHTTRIEIVGYVVGQLWWPAGTEAYKPIDYNLLRERQRMVGGDTLRDHVLALTADGDFQGGTTLADCQLLITMEDDEKMRRVTRGYSLSHFPSIADCLHPEHDEWCPPCDEEG